MESHIIPAFVGRYLKETSATGYMIAAESNRRVQGLPKEPLLCPDCEQRFSRWERIFSLEVFPKIQDDEFRGFEYDSSLLKFAVSLSWRVLRIDRKEFLQDLPQFEAKIDSTLENWRRYLLDEQNIPQSVQHLFVMPGIPTNMPPGSHPKTVQYLLRGVDGTELIGSRSLGVYVKLLRTILYAPIIPANPTGWSKTRIHAGPGRLGMNQKISMAGFEAFLQSRVEEMFREPLSERQLDRIREAIKKNPRRALASESLKVNRETEELWDIAFNALDE